METFIEQYNVLTKYIPDSVVKHAAKLPTEVEVCFRMMRPPHVCTDPTCKRSHDKQKIYEVINANLKSLMTSKLSFVEDSTENQDNSP